MKNGKLTLFFAFLFLILLFSGIATAINLDIRTKQISNSIITDLNQPAVFDLTITNKGDFDTFKIYSLVGIDISPTDEFSLTSGETKIIRITLTPQESLKEREEPFPFEYEIKNSKNEVQKGVLTINIFDLSRAISITPENFNPKSENLRVKVKNKATYDFSGIKLTFSSQFFDDFSQTMDLKQLEEKTIDIPIDKEKQKTLDAGHYLIKIVLETNGIRAEKEEVVNFVETPNIETTEKKSGFIIQKIEIIKRNIGNVRERVTITKEKNLFSFLFTTTNIVPVEAKTNNFQRVYTWEKDLAPNEELKVVMTTNWIYPILVIILIILGIYFIKKYVERDIILRKNVSFVRTKGGEFALRVHLKVKAQKQINNIHIIDHIPHLVNLYEKFGAVSPYKVDSSGKRIEWKTERMARGEERVFSYIIYSSKIGVIGRFELPEATALYEKDSKRKHATSNRAFYINEPKKI